MDKAGHKPGTYFTYNKKRSITAMGLAVSLKILGLKTILKKDFNKSRHKKTDQPKSFTKKYLIQTKQISGKIIWIIKPKAGESHKTILYLHGGAYFYGIQRLYWSFIAELVRRTGATVIIPDYPLTPENNAAHVYEFMEKTYEWTISNTKKSKLILLGDSAGAGLAFGFTQYLRNEGRQMPLKLILLSPWLDVSLKNSDIEPLKKRDPQLDTDTLKNIGRHYAGSWDTKDYRISPIYGSLNDLPPVSIFTSTHDILFADCNKIRKHFTEMNLDLNYFIYPKLVHDWAVIMPRMKEGKQVLTQIKDIINE